MTDLTIQPCNRERKNMYDSLLRWSYLTVWLLWGQRSIDLDRVQTSRNKTRATLTLPWLVLLVTLQDTSGGQKMKEEETMVFPSLHQCFPSFRAICCADGCVG